MDVLSTFFQEVLENPEPFLRDRSITKLWYFMAGYRYGKDGYGKLKDPLYYGFTNWLAHRWHLVPPEINSSDTWASILLFISVNSEHRAFNLAKELWYEYKAEMQQSDNEKNKYTI